MAPLTAVQGLEELSGANAAAVPARVAKRTTFILRDGCVGNIMEVRYLFGVSCINSSRFGVSEKFNQPNPMVEEVKTQIKIYIHTLCTYRRPCPIKLISVPFFRC
jgi:hypothetical protein